MTSISREKLANHYYNLGIQAGSTVKTSSARQVLRKIAPIMPAVGGLGGLAGGGLVGLDRGGGLALSLAKELAEEGDHLGYAVMSAMGIPALGITGLVAGGALGGYGGKRLGMSTRDLILQSLRNKS